MSSPFQKSFSAKNPMSPIKNTQKKAGAYTSGADGMVAQSDRVAFDGLTDSIVGTTLDVFERANKKKVNDSAGLSDEDSYYYDYD
jgi:hypothetical protein